MPTLAISTTKKTVHLTTHQNALFQACPGVPWLLAKSRENSSSSREEIACSQTTASTWLRGLQPLRHLTTSSRIYSTLIWGQAIKFICSHKTRKTLNTKALVLPPDTNTTINPPSLFPSTQKDSDSDIQPWSLCQRPAPDTRTSSCCLRRQVLASVL